VLRFGLVNAPVGAYTAAQDSSGSPHRQGRLAAAAAHATLERKKVYRRRSDGRDARRR
jgi:hypothetical protein